MTRHWSSKDTILSSCMSALKLKNLYSLSLLSPQPPNWNAFSPKKVQIFSLFFFLLSKLICFYFISTHFLFPKFSLFFSSKKSMLFFSSFKILLHFFSGIFQFFFLLFHFLLFSFLFVFFSFSFSFKFGTCRYHFFSLLSNASLFNIRITSAHPQNSE